MKPTLRSPALGTQLAALLRDAIVSGTLEPGTHMVEDWIATEHDVSRGPVRDALRILEAEGLVEGRRRGYYVRGFDEHDIDEIYAVREAIEQVAGRLAITRRADLSVAADRVDRMRLAADADDHGLFAIHDLAFHTQFYLLSGNSRLLALWSQYQPTFAALLGVTIAQDRDLHPATDDHARLLEFAKTGDEAGFATELTWHLDGSKRRMTTAMNARRH